MLTLHKRKSGFTLIELAIVLGIAGVLFGGLWRLLSTSNIQMRDQATATQHQQIVNAVSSYLQSEKGRDYMSLIDANNTDVLPLPPAASFSGSSGCSVALEAAKTHTGTLCNFLPPGVSEATTNPYGQTYSIRVMKDGTPLNQHPQTYSFVVLTKSGDAIPDTSGGRISAMIGGDGGFLYNNDVCGNPASTACGSFGSWSATLVGADPGQYNFDALDSKSGHVASRTYFGGSLALGSWLARVKMPGDADASATTSPFYNTMQTDLFLGGNNKDFYFGNTTVDNTVPNSLVSGTGSTMFLQGGQIDLGGGATGLQAKIVGTMNDAASSSLIKLQASVAVGNALLYLEGPAAGGITALGVAKGNIRLTDGYIESPTFTYSSSDIRLKKNIKPLTDALANIMKIKPVSFVFKSNDKKSMGVIAQDLEKIYPQLVMDGPNGMKSVGYEGLIAPLIGSVQELKKENDRLKSDLRIQIERQDKLEKEIERLRQK